MGCGLIKAEIQQPKVNAVGSGHSPPGHTVIKYLVACRMRCCHVGDEEQALVLASVVQVGNLN